MHAPRFLSMATAAGLAMAITAIIALGFSEPANARKLSFKECQALVLAGADQPGRTRVGHGQSNKFKSVLQDCNRYRRQVASPGEAKARRGHPDAEALGVLLDVMGHSGSKHGKKRHH